jgi:APA family basic amino acid/polyamine antiporter
VIQVPAANKPATQDASRFDPTVPSKRRATLGLFDATTLVAGSMIGGGIFLVSADIARLTHSAGWLLAVWLLAGLLTLTAALSYGELAAMFPKAGGQYVYLREAFGPSAAFLFGWTQLLVITTGTIAAVAVGFARFLGVLWPAITERSLVGIVLPHFGWLGVTPQRLVAMALIVGLTWANGRGLQTGKLLQNGFTVAKGVVLLAIVGVAIVARPSVAGALHESPFFGPLPVATLGPAMVGALFAADAWNAITFTAGEVRDPQRNVPRSLIWGTGLVIALYLAVNVSYLAVLPLDRIAEAPSQRVASAMVGTAFGSGAAAFVAVGILISTFGCANGLTLAGARVSYAMALDGLFFQSAGKVNRHGVPGVALWMQAIWASLLCLSGTYSQLLQYVVFAVLLFYVLTLLGLFALRRKRPHLKRPYRALGYPLIPVLYVLAATTIAGSLLIAKETRVQALAGLGCVLAGTPVYFWLSRLRAAGR